MVQRSASDAASLTRIEVRSIDHIPPEERHGRVRDQFTLWFGLNCHIFPVVLGGVAIFLGLNFIWACLSIVLGVLTGLVLVGFHAMQGPRLGVPQMIQSRGQFGFHGAILVLAASIVVDFGFLAAQLVIQAEAMNSLVHSISIPLWIAVLTAPVLALTIYGYNWIHLWQRWMTVILAVTFAVIAVQTLNYGHLRGAVAQTTAPSLATFMTVTAIFVFAMVSWAPYVSDYSRYLPEDVSPLRTFWAVFLGCAIPTIVCAILGAYITGLLPDASSTVAAIRTVAGAWALPIMAISLIGADAANAYTGMLAIAGIVSSFTEVRRSVAIRVVGSVVVIAAGSICALLGYHHFVNNLSNFLNVLLCVFIPWTAINLTDYYLIRHGDYDIPSFFSPTGIYGRVRWRGLIPYLLAVAAQLPFMDQTYYTGPLVKTIGGADISWIVGGLAGFLFYLIAMRFPAGIHAAPIDRTTTSGDAVSVPQEEAVA